MDGGLLPLAGTPTVPGGGQPPLPGTEAVLIGLVALAITVIPFLWALASHLNAMAHEGAHALAGSLLGLSPSGVTLSPRATGGTSFPAAMRGPRGVIIGTVGYLGPSGFGLGAARLIETGHPGAVLWMAVILLALLLFLIRRSFGLVSVSVAIALLAVTMRYAGSGLEEVTAYGMTWVLLLSGVRVAIGHGIDAVDAAILSVMTRLPRRLWALLWLGGTLLAVVIGGKWLVLRS